MLESSALSALGGFGTFSFGWDDPPTARSRRSSIEKLVAKISLAFPSTVALGLRLSRQEKRDFSNAYRESNVTKIWEVRKITESAQVMIQIVSINRTSRTRAARAWPGRDHSDTGLISTIWDMESLECWRKEPRTPCSFAMLRSFPRSSREVESDIIDLEKEEECVAMVGAELRGFKTLSKKLLRGVDSPPLQILHHSPRKGQKIRG